MFPISVTIQNLRTLHSMVVVLFPPHKFGLSSLCYCWGKESYHVKRWPSDAFCLCKFPSTQSISAYIIFITWSWMDGPAHTRYWQYHKINHKCKFSFDTIVWLWERGYRRISCNGYMSLENIQGGSVFIKSCTNLSKNRLVWDCKVV
jgi:hypothetical protein